MGRGKGIPPRKDPSPHEVGMVGRRTFMEHLHPLPPSSRRSDRPRPSKRPRTQPSPNFLYAPNRHLDVEKLLASSPVRHVCIHIPSDHLTPCAPTVRARQLWGSDEYTDDSDIVAVLLHSGRLPLDSTRLDFLSVRIRVDRHICRVSPPFQGVLRNGIASRSWGSVYEGGRLCIMDVSVVRGECVSAQVREPRWMGLPGGLPGLACGRGRRVGESVVGFDLSNRPCLRYELRHVASVGGRQPVVRLEEEVLQVEGLGIRYELSLAKGKVTFAKVKSDAILGEMFAAVGVGKGVSCPAKGDDVAVIAQVPWEELCWDASGVCVQGKHYALKKVAFRKRSE